MSRPAVEVRDAAPGDADLLFANLRPADLAEGEALAGRGRVREAIDRSIADSTHCWTAWAGADLMCMFGVAPVSLLSDDGVPWMLGTPVVARERRALTRLARPYIARMLAAHPRLVNVVDARNVAAMRFLRHVGFQLLPAQPLGVAGLPFHPFVMER